MTDTLRLTDDSAAERAAWLEARRSGIGASDAAAVLGVSKWRGPLEVYCDKLGIIDEEAERHETERMQWGLALEPVIAERYQRETGRELSDPGRYTVIRSQTYPFMLATLDRVQVAPDRGAGVLEIKTTSAYHRDEWADGEPPLQYQVQVQHQLAVTDYQWASIAVLFGGQEFAWMDIARDDAFIEALIQKEAEFWDRVERRDPPPPDASDSCREMLGRLYPREVAGKVVALPPEAAEWDRVRLEATEIEKRAKAAKTEAENNLRAAIGDAESGILPDGTRYSLKWQKTAAYTVGEKEFRVLRRKAAK